MKIQIFQVSRGQTIDLYDEQTIIICCLLVSAVFPDFQICLVLSDGPLCDVLYARVYFEGIIEQLDVYVHVSGVECYSQGLSPLSFKPPGLTCQSFCLVCLQVK